MHHVGEDHRRELLQLVVVAERCVVVELAGVRDATFGGRQLLLQGKEVLVGLEVRIGLAQREDLAQSAGDGSVRLSLGNGVARRGDGGVAGFDDGVEGFLLVRGVGLDRLDQVRDQIDTALELHVDLGPGVLHLVAAADQTVVHEDAEQHQQHDDRNDNQQDSH